jgi:hypothetical protein
MSVNLLKDILLDVTSGEPCDYVGRYGVDAYLQYQSLILAPKDQVSALADHLKQLNQPINKTKPGKPE